MSAPASAVKHVPFYQQIILVNGIPLNEKLTFAIPKEIQEEPVVVCLINSGSPHTFLKPMDSKIGEGSFGQVFQLVQITEISARTPINDLVVKMGEIKRQDEIAALQREVAGMKKYHGGPAQLTYTFDPNTNKGCYYIVMKKVPGTPLTNYLQRNDLFNIDKLKIIHAVAKMMYHLHRGLKIIHGDFSAHNIHIEYDPTKKEYVAHPVDMSFYSKIGEPATLVWSKCDYLTDDRIAKPVCSHIKLCQKRPDKADPTILYVIKSGGLIKLFFAEDEMECSAKAFSKFTFPADHNEVDVPMTAENINHFEKYIDIFVHSQPPESSEYHDIFALWYFLTHDELAQDWDVYFLRPMPHDTATFLRLAQQFLAKEMLYQECAYRGNEPLVDANARLFSPLNHIIIREISRLRESVQPGTKEKRQALRKALDAANKLVEYDSVKKQNIVVQDELQVLRELFLNYQAPEGLSLAAILTAKRTWLGQLVIAESTTQPIAESPHSQQALDTLYKLSLHN